MKNILRATGTAILLAGAMFGAAHIWTAVKYGTTHLGIYELGNGQGAYVGEAITLNSTSDVSDAQLREMLEHAIEIRHNSN